jgi:ABC-2 type transport system permease protein
MTVVAPPRRSDLGTGGVTLSRVIRSECIKLRSLRSTWFSLLAAIVIIVGLGALFSSLRAHRFGRFDRLGFDPTLVSLRGVFLAQLAIGVLGVLVISGEYATGMIRSSLAAVPHRQPVLLAKALVFAVTVFVISEVAALAAFLVGQRALASTHLQATLSTPHAERAIFGAGLYLTLVGLLAVGLGFLIRNTAGAIATLFGILLVLPILADALPSPYSTDVSKYLPLNAGTQIMSTTRPDPTMLAPWTGVGIMAVYALVALICGAFVLQHRDS